MSLENVVFGWPANSYTGWGSPGVQLMLNWPGAALSAYPDISASLAPKDRRASLLRERQEQSQQLQAGLSAMPKLEATVNCPAFVPLGNGFETPTVVGGKRLVGQPTIGFAVFEELDVCERGLENLRQYPLVITYSRWNEAWLWDWGVNAQCVHQGYDPVLFNPGVKKKRESGLFWQRAGDIKSQFRVFSGGKCEYRKGQDIVLKAFSRFAERHDDAVLVAAWGNFWPGLVKTFAGTDVETPPGAEIGMPNYRAWAQRLGIKPHQIEIVPAVPNWRMPEVIGGCDAALFCNRTEGGTNLIGMEAAACGLPVLMSNESGHKELPRSMARWHRVGDIDEIVNDLELTYHGETVTIPLGERWAWPNRIAELRDVLGAAL